MPWKPAIYMRGNSENLVMALCKANGQLIRTSNKARVYYSPRDKTSYTPAFHTVKPIGVGPVIPDEDITKASGFNWIKNYKKAQRKEERLLADEVAAHVVAAPAKLASGTTVAYVDGSCPGNPGPTGAGVVLRENGTTRELSKFLSMGTNNMAELSAIQEAADGVKDPTKQVVIYSDSTYAIGVLIKSHKANANKELVAQVRRSLLRLQRFDLKYVKAHAGIAGNERADVLAKRAAMSGSTSGWKVV